MRDCNPSLLRAKVHQLVFLPILTGAKEAGKLDCIPSACDLLEMVYVLPSKPGTHKLIIARFRDRILRSTCLRLKKLNAPRSMAAAAATTLLVGEEQQRAVWRTAGTGVLKVAVAVLDPAVRGGSPSPPMRA
jgi:hypothetical protein